MGDRVGQQLGNYRLIRLLGQGGFAKVYLGEHVYLKTRAAIKVLRVHLTKEHEQDFLKEAQILAQLEHPNIVSILDFGIHEEIPFLVMQYALSGNIRNSHPKGTIIPTTTLLSYLKHIASALQYAHDRKIIHRDVKPENMLLGQNNRLLLSDFGLALVASSLPHQQNVVGTVSYMAPEQLQGHPCIASDQYALGVVVYEWLCGIPPFSGSHLEIATQHLMATPSPLSQRNPAISPAVEQAVMTALAKEPTQRFVHITAFAAVLEQALLESSEGQKQKAISTIHSIQHQQDHVFVGRIEERASLRQLFRETERQRQTSQESLSFSGRPTRTSSTLLLGDAGIGKTRLAEEMGHEALQSGWAIIQARSYEQESHVPYQVWIEVLSHIVKRKLWNPQEDSLSPLFYQSLGFLMPEYSDVFSQEKNTVSQVVGSEPLRIKEAIYAVLTAISKRIPLLVILDDLHWADSSSVELFGYLVRRLVDFPVLLLGTCRHSEISSKCTLPMLFSQLQKERLLTQVMLAPLTDEQIGMLVAYLPEPLIASVQHQAAGNPFFAEELARTCLAQRKDSRNTQIFSSAQQNIVLPETVAAVLDQYLNKLSSTCQQLLGCAAVLGKSFSFFVLSSLYAKGKTTRNEEELLSSLEEALAAKILLEEGSGNNIIYHFRHPLLMSRMYENVSMMRRAILHRHTAEILCKVYAAHEEEGAALITHHLLHGGADSHMIADYAERAGNYAYTLAAYPEAERHYRLAIEQQKSYFGGEQETQQKQIVLIEVSHHQALLLEQLGECLIIQGRYEEARYSYEQALEIWSRCPSMQEVQQERQLLAMLCIKIGQTWYDKNNLVQAQQCFEMGEQVLQEGEITEGTARAYLCLKQSYIPWHQGFYNAALLLAQKALILFEQALSQPCVDSIGLAPVTQIRRTLIGDPVDLGRTHILLAVIYAALGQFDVSLDHLNQALTIFEHYHCQREIAITCCNIGDLYIRKADYAQAQGVLHRSLNLAEHMGDVPLAVFALCNLGILQLRTGRLVSAETVFIRGISLIKSLNDADAVALLHISLASALREQGDFDKASDMLRIVLQTGRLEHTAPIIGIILVAIGQLRIDQAIGIADKHEILCVRLLMRARNTLRRALAIQVLDAETRVEGQLVLAHIMLLEGNVEAAYQQILQILETTQKLELMWLVPHAQCLLGNILSALGQDESADKYFILAKDGFHNYGMRLAYGRALQFYGKFLQKRDISSGKIYQQGQAYLREACEIFRECDANRDFQRLEQILKGVSDDYTQQFVVENRTEFSPVS